MKKEPWQKGRIVSMPNANKETILIPSWVPQDRQEAFAKMTRKDRRAFARKVNKIGNIKRELLGMAIPMDRIGANHGIK